MLVANIKIQPAERVYECSWFKFRWSDGLKAVKTCSAQIG